MLIACLCVLDAAAGTDLLLLLAAPAPDTLSVAARERVCAALVAALQVAEGAVLVPLTDNFCQIEFLSRRRNAFSAV